MSSIEEIRNKKLEELMKHQETTQSQEQAQLQQQIGQLETVVKQHLSKEALLRFGNIKAAHPEKAVQILIIFSQMIQSGRVTGKIDDSTFKKVLEQITPKKKDIKIHRV